MENERKTTDRHVHVERGGGVRNYVHAPDCLVEGVRGDNVLDDCVLELRLMLGEHSDPFLGFGFRATGSADGVSFLEEGERDGCAYKADR